MHEPTGCCHAPVMVQARWDTPPRPGAHVPVATEPAAVVGHEAAAVAIAWQKISKRDAPPPPPPPWSARTHATTRYTGARTGARGGGRDIDPHAGEAAVTLRRAGPPGVAHAGHQRVARQGRGIGRLVDSDVGTRVPCTRHHARPCVERGTNKDAKSEHVARTLALHSGRLPAAAGAQARRRAEPARHTSARSNGVDHTHGPIGIVVVGQQRARVRCIYATACVSQRH
jgi:hypothetical protein